jgi:hypothetical protein
VKSKYILPFFLLFQILFLQIIAYFPSVVERFYSNGIYPKIALFSRYILGKIPFSVGDCFYAILIFFVIRWFFKNKKTWKTNWRNNILSILGFTAIFYFLFHFLWAFNYLRQPLSEKMKIKKEYSDNDLLLFTQKLIIKTNAIQFQITKNKNVKVLSPYAQKQLFKMTELGYDNLKKEYSFFEYKNPSIKKSLFSLPLTYMGFGGYLNPFTNEAQVNDKLPLYGFPMVVCHEMAHQMGYGSESECNFIGFLACIKNDDLYFQYAAYTTALRYCLNTIEEKNPKNLKPIQTKINRGILAYFKESETFWENYETPIETGFKLFYDNYLKMNQQKDGLDSYSKFLDLLINFYKEKPL